MPLILEIPNVPVSLQEQATKCNDSDSFALSPSTLFERRRSETILDFPAPPAGSTLSPPSHSLSAPSTPPQYSPAASHISFSSSSTDNSSACPRTPTPSENDNDVDFQNDTKEDDCFVTIEDFAQALDLRSPRSPRRSASALSLRSFSTAEFDVRVEPIYALMHPRPAPPVPTVPLPPRPNNIQAPRDGSLQVRPQNDGRSSPNVLSVLDSAHGGSFDVPLLLCSYLSPPSSPCSSNASDDESDGEGIPISWSDSETDDRPHGAAISSSDEDDSDGEAPSRAQDPGSRVRRHPRSISKGRRVNPWLEPLNVECESPDTPSDYSCASSALVATPVEWYHGRTLPRKSLVPSDVSSSRFSTVSSSFQPDEPSIMPELRSRFSSSTLASINDLPTSASSKSAFFARLTGRGGSKQPLPLSPSKGGERTQLSFSPKSERSSSLNAMTSNTRRASVRNRRPPALPVSPAPSAFSFSTLSTSSRSSLDSSGDSCSCVSDDSMGSIGLRRPPIPIELFLRG